MACFLCGHPEAEVQGLPPLDRKFGVKCLRCGSYLITEEAVRWIGEGENQLPDVASKLPVLSAHCRWLAETGQKAPTLIEAYFSNEPEFVGAYEDFVGPDIPKTTNEKAEKILRFIRLRVGVPGRPTRINLKDDYPVGYCLDSDEFRQYLQHLDRIGYLEASWVMGPMQNVGLTIDGLSALEETDAATAGEARNAKAQAFVAMRIHKSFDDAFAAIESLRGPTGFAYLRIDKKQFNNRIDEEILSEIRESTFMIVDMTEHRNAVYFEAGYAMGFGIPVIWTCREDDIGNASFDTRQYNHILWGTPQELHDKLLARIRDTVLRHIR